MTDRGGRRFGLGENGTPVAVGSRGGGRRVGIQTALAHPAVAGVIRTAIEDVVLGSCTPGLQAQ